MAPQTYDLRSLAPALLGPGIPLFVAGRPFVVRATMNESFQPMGYMDERASTIMLNGRVLFSPQPQRALGTILHEIIHAITSMARLKEVERPRLLGGYDITHAAIHAIAMAMDTTLRDVRNREGPTSILLP